MKTLIRHSIPSLLILATTASSIEVYAESINLDNRIVRPAVGVKSLPNSTNQAIQPLNPPPVSPSQNTAANNGLQPASPNNPLPAISDANQQPLLPNSIERSKSLTPNALQPTQTIQPLGAPAPVQILQPAGQTTLNPSGLPLQNTIGANQRINGNVLPLNNAKQLQSYANLPDSQLVQLPMSERNLVVTLGEVRKKFADDGVKSTAGGGSDIKFSNKRNTPNVSAVDSMFAAARAAASAAQAMTLSKAIKINGQTSPSVWLLAWNKPYYIESSDFKGPTSVKLQFSKQGKTFDLPITPGSSKAGGVAFSIPSSVVGVYQQPARVIVNDSDGATYTSADSTFYPHIITKSFKDIQVEITGNRFTPITSLGEIKVDSNGFSFKSQQRSDNPSNTGKAAFFNVEIKNFSPYWNIDDFGSGVVQYGPESVCDSFFAQQSNSGPNNVYFYNDWGGFDPTSYNSGQASQGRLIAVAPVIHCRSKYYTRANEHLFMGKSVIHLEISGPEGIPYNAGAGSPSPD
ncbi:MAG: hypothetical protein WC696_06160 [Candidatus Methylopumilus sp.]|jgi:hypothetical protein